MMWGTAKDISAWDCNEEPNVPLEQADRGQLFQIDYVCVSGHDRKTGKNLVHAAEAVNGKRFWRSDNFPVLLKPVPSMNYKYCSTCNTNGGWKWESESSRRLFCNDVMTAVIFDGCSRTVGNYNDGQLGALERVMCDSAQLHAHSSTHSGNSEMSRAPPALVEARRLPKAAVTKSEKNAVRKIEKK